MKVTILGSGPSSGVPTIHDGWGACDPENPKNRRLRPSILVEDAETRILVDTAPDMREQLIGVGVRHLDAVLYTHGHADHLHGLDDLRSVNRAMNGPIDVYADAGTMATIETRFAYATKPLAEGADFYYKPVLTMHEIGPGSAFSVGSIDVLAIDQDHGHSRTLGFRFGPVAYTTDLMALPEASFQALDGVETWLIGVFSWAPHATHAHVDLALEWVKRVKPRRAVLTHLGPAIDHGELTAYVPAGVEAAYDGMVIEA